MNFNKSSIFRPAICLFLQLLSTSSSAVIECDYRIADWFSIGKHYQCKVENDPYILSAEDAVITSVTGTHFEDKTNDDVVSISFDFKNMTFFPRGLEMFFKDLKAIHVYRGTLKELHQSDFKELSKLIVISIGATQVEVLEEGLFDYNRELQYIFLVYNRISKIEPNVFDHLNKLESLDLQSNVCINKYSMYNKRETKHLIERAKSMCTGSL